MEALPKHASLAIVGVAEDERRLDALVQGAERSGKEQKEDIIGATDGTQKMRIRESEEIGTREISRIRGRNGEMEDSLELAGRTVTSDATTPKPEFFRHVCVLTPSPSSITLADYQKQKSLDLKADAILFVVLDGTWYELFDLLIFVVYLLFRFTSSILFSFVSMLFRFVAM
jgi:hypothetical protein